MLYILQKPTNSTKLNSVSSGSKAAILPFSTALQHFSYQRVALYFNYTLLRLYVVFTLHLCIPLFCIHLMFTSQHRIHIGTGGAEWSHLVETIVLPHFDLPNRLVLERHLFAGPLPSLESTPPIIRVVHPLSGIVF